MPLRCVPWYPCAWRHARPPEFLGKFQAMGKCWCAIDPHFLPETRIFPGNRRPSATGERSGVEVTGEVRARAADHARRAHPAVVESMTQETTTTPRSVGCRAARSPYPYGSR